MKKTSIAVALGLSLLLVGGAAWAEAVLHIGAHEGDYLYDGEVRPLEGNTVTILENGDGQPTLSSLKLILGIPVLNGTTAPTISSVVGPTVGTGSLTSGPTSFSSGEVYGTLGLSGPVNRSNNFGNWYEAVNTVTGLSFSSFNLYVYDLTGTGISGGEIVTVTFEGNLPLGTMAVAYGTGSGPFSTPFTESGMVPEPGTLLLLGSGLVGLGLYRRKFKP